MTTMRQAVVARLKGRSGLPPKPLPKNTPPIGGSVTGTRKQRKQAEWTQYDKFVQAFKDLDPR